MTRPHRSLIAAASAALLAAAGISAGIAGGAAADNPAPSLGDPAPDSQPRTMSAQENLAKDLGEAGALVSDDGAEIFRLTVTSAERASACPSRANELAPAAGEFLILTVSAHLAAEATHFTDEAAGDVYFPLLPETFRVTGPAGTVLEGVHTRAAWECFADEELLPSFIFPGESVTGLLVLETSADQGAVAYMPAGAAGWEWSFG